ncbi:three-Cys-motif partner protein TcmP, partial [Pseudomonas kitaguniensis]|uniref:three-Cys-motif partner protein TcmP n=2 Tax=Pseudomonadota TaxID=1224 RepID=UPI003CFBC9BC
PFRHFIFIEKDPNRVKSLEAVKDEYPGVDIQVLHGDANSQLLQMVSNMPWTRKARSMSRGVVFLDPFSMQVDWSTL